MYEFTLNNKNYYIDVEETAYIFADIYIGRIYDEKSGILAGVVMVDENEIILKRIKDNSLVEYMESRKDEFIKYCSEI